LGKRLPETGQQTALAGYRPCYVLFFGSGIAVFQRLGPDLFCASRARGTEPAAAIALVTAGRQPGSCNLRGNHLIPT